MSDAKRKPKKPKISEKKYEPLINEIRESPDLNSMMLSFLEPAELKRSLGRVNRDYYHQANSISYQHIFDLSEDAYKQLSQEIKDNIDVIYSLLYTIYKTQVDAGSKDILKSNGHNPYAFLFDLYLKNKLDHEITVACRQHPELAAKVIAIPLLSNKLKDIDREIRSVGFSSRLKGAAVGALAALKKLGFYCISLYWILNPIIYRVSLVFLLLLTFDYFQVMPPEVLPAVMNYISNYWFVFLIAAFAAFLYVLAADGLGIDPVEQFRTGFFSLDEMLESAVKQSWELIKSPFKLVASMGKCVYEGYHAGHKIAWNKFNKLAYNSDYFPFRRTSLLEIIFPPFHSWLNVADSYNDEPITPYRTVFEAAAEFNQHIPILKELRESEPPVNKDKLSQGTYAQLDAPLEIKSSEKLIKVSSIRHSNISDISTPLLGANQKSYGPASTDDEVDHIIEFRLN